MKEDFWTPRVQQGFAEGSGNFMFLNFWAAHLVTLDISRLPQKIKTIFNLSSSLIEINMETLVFLL